MLQLKEKEKPSGFDPSPPHKKETEKNGDFVICIDASKKGLDLF